MKEAYSLRKLAKEFNLDRATVAKICKGIKTEAEARAALTEYKDNRENTQNFELDPETGLSWWQAKLREEVISKRIERERAQALAGGELVPIAVINQALEVVAASWDKFTNDFYCYGNTELNADQREAVQKLAAQAKEDYLAYVKTWQERQIERRKDGSGTLED